MASSAGDDSRRTPPRRARASATSGDPERVAGDSPGEPHQTVIGRAAESE